MYCIVLYCIVLYCIVLYGIVLVIYSVCVWTEVKWCWLKCRLDVLEPQGIHTSRITYAISKCLKPWKATVTVEYWKRNSKRQIIDVWITVFWMVLFCLTPYCGFGFNHLRSINRVMAVTIYHNTNVFPGHGGAGRYNIPTGAMGCEIQSWLDKTLHTLK